jgi:hypothetical protein
MTDDGGSGSGAPKEVPSAAPPPPPKTDVVVLGPPTADGGGVHVLRARNEQLEAGELRTIKEGKPIVGEIVSLAPRPDNPRVCDVRESYRPTSGSTPTRKGPAQVATQEYRDNWDEVFGKKSDLN